MAKLCQFQRSESGNHETVWINPMNVSELSAGKDGSVVITFAGKHTATVVGELNGVAAKIEQALY
jgi:hypothetical protein